MICSQQTLDCGCWAGGNMFKAFHGAEMQIKPLIAVTGGEWLETDYVSKNSRLIMLLLFNISIKQSKDLRRPRSRKQILLFTSVFGLQPQECVCICTSTQESHRTVIVMKL